tara:strand:- start:275 stop:1279 length:1005 start_codon:yes stop_codon:yes gene_type:complete
MAYIGKSPVIGNFVKLDAITAVNGQAAYTMQNGGSNFTDYESVNQFLVSLNGTIQAPTDSFTVSGSTLTFASNLSTGDVIDFIMVFGNSLSAGTPTDSTVTAAKLNDDIISGQTALASEPADTDEFLVSDAGVLKRLDYSLIKAAPAIELLATTTVSSAVSSVSFDGYFSSTYKNYKIIYNNAMPVSDNIEFRLRVRQSNADKTDSSSYRTILACAQGEFTGDGDVGGGNTEEKLQADYALLTEKSTEGNVESTDVYGGVSGEITIMDPLQTSYNKIIFTKSQHTGANDNNGNFSFFSNGVVRYVNNANALSGVSFFYSSGNIDGGVFKLYGIK